MSGDEFSYPIPARDAAGRPRQVDVSLSDDGHVALHVPPPGVAVIARDDVDALVEAMCSIRNIGEHRASRRDTT